MRKLVCLDVLNSYVLLRSYILFMVPKLCTCTELKGTEQIRAAFDKFFSSTKVSAEISVHYNIIMLYSCLNPLLLLIPGEWKETRGQV